MENDGGINVFFLARETDVLGENLPRHYLFHQKSHLPDPDANPGRRGGKPATNRFSYSAACASVMVLIIK
jgi:hypothetical protein